MGGTSGLSITGALILIFDATSAACGAVFALRRPQASRAILERSAVRSASSLDP
jgi:hypothetical protein